MALGFGNNVARLSATLELDDDGFMKGMAEASAKLDAYNAKLKEEGVGRRFATMASRDYAKQLYNEARGVDQVTQSHGRLITTLQNAQRHWKLLGATTAGAGVGILALTGHLSTLTGAFTQLGASALPMVSQALSGILTPFAALAAVVVGLAGPLSALITLFGVVGGGAGLGLYKALTGTSSAFAPVRKMLQGAKKDFHDLGVALGKDFLPYAEKGVQWLDKFLNYGIKLAGMKNLGDVIHSISTQGIAMLEHLNRAIYNMIGRPILQIFTASFGQAGNRISSGFAHILDVWKPLVEKMFNIFESWFDKQHFEQTGARWAAALTNAFISIALPAMWSALKSQFMQQSFWGKVGQIAGLAFAANFLTGGWLLRGGAGIVSRLLGGGAGGAAAAGGASVAGGGVAAGGGGGGIIAALGGAAGVAAIVGVAVPAALVYLSSRQSSASQNKFGSGPGITPRGPGSPGYLPDNIRAAAAADTKALNQVAAAEKNLNQYIKDGGKSVLGWKIAVGQSTNQAQKAASAIHDMAQKGIISADQAAKDSRSNLQTFISQQDAIAQKATAAAGNVAKFGASTRAQYAHVAALARTSAQLADAINAIPSQKYVQLVVSITENLRSQGNAPGQGRGIGAAGGIVSGGVPNRDSVKALLMPGEVVLSKPAVAALGGPHAANSLNPNGGYIHMADGGIVPPPRHKKEKRNAYRGRVSTWLANTVASKQGILDFDIAIADRVAQRDDVDGNYSGEIAQLLREQKFRRQEIKLFNRAARVARRFGLRGSERGFHQDAAFVMQDILDTQETIEGLKGQTSAGAAGGVPLSTQIAAFLAQQQSFINQFGSNIILGGAAAVATGPSAGGGGTTSSGGRLPFRSTQAGGGVTIHNHFTQTPPDSFVHIRKARLQAAAVFQ